MNANKMIASLSPRVAAVDPERQAALDVKIEAARAEAPPLPRAVPSYNADPDHFAMQMGVFERMRETEREFARRAKGGRP